MSKQFIKVYSFIIYDEDVFINLSFKIKNDNSRHEKLIDLTKKYYTISFVPDDQRTV